MMDGANMLGNTADAKTELDGLRIRLYRNGFHPLPIISYDQPVAKAGKQPAIAKWQKPVADEAAIAAWSGQSGWRTAANTGVLCGEVVGVDIDMPDAALAAEIRALTERELGTTPMVRFGAAPKLLLVYRIDAPAGVVTSKIATPALLLEDGTKVQVEMLAERHQFVAFGTHPNTKQPYRWEGASPLDVKMRDLPVVTRDQLLDLKDAAENLLREKGGLTKQERADTAGRTRGAGEVTAEAADGEAFFRRVNRAALDALAAWAPEIFPSGHFEKGTGAFRINSVDLGRELEEDLSIHPIHGARDFGEEVSCSPIDIVIRHGAEAGVIDRVDALTGEPDALTAALWLCAQLGIDPVTLGYRQEHSEIAALVAEFNEKHFVTVEGGRTIVMSERYDSTLDRTYYTRSRFQDVEQLHSHRRFRVGEKKNKEPNFKSAGELWLSHKNRRTYPSGVVFDPSGREHKDQFNLWRGFAIEPKPGDWSLMQRHMLDVICGGNIDLCLYLHGLMARMVQRPWETGEVVVVLRGDEGVGKGVLARTLIRLFGRHGLQVTNPEHLTGKFNEHLRDVVMLLADECFFAGDRAHVGILKALATENTLMVEPKGFPAVPVPNCLHIFMASNNEWVVPAALGSRRFFVLDVLPIHKGDHAYFNALWQQMEHEDGLAAMLYDLLRHDLSDFNHRDIPTTQGLIDQRKLSLPIPQRWWLDVLSRGFVFASKHGHADYFGEWHEVDRHRVAVQQLPGFLAPAPGPRSADPGDVRLFRRQNGRHRKAPPGEQRDGRGPSRLVRHRRPWGLSARNPGSGAGGVCRQDRADRHVGIGRVLAALKTTRCRLFRPGGLPLFWPTSGRANRGRHD